MKIVLLFMIYGRLCDCARESDDDGNRMVYFFRQNRHKYSSIVR